MSVRKKIFLIIFPLLIVGLNFALYTWNQSLKVEEVSYLVDTPADKVAFDGQGRVWVYGGGELKLYENGAPIQVFTENDTPALGGELWALVVDHKGRTWIAPRWGTNTVELAVFDGTKWSTFLPLPDSLSSEKKVGVTAFAIDTHGRTWIGAEEQGLYVIDGEIWKNYSVENSELLSNNVMCIVFDNQGRAWIGTRGGGLNIFDGEVWQTFTTKNSPLLGVKVDAIAFDRQDRAWIASTKGMNVLDGKNWTSHPNLSNVIDIAVDGQGRVWAMKGFDAGIVVFDGEMQKYYFDPYHLSVGTEFGWGAWIAAGIDGNIWIATDNGVVNIPPDSPQPISYAAGILSIAITSSGLIYFTIWLIVVWLCVALNAWRNLVFSLLGFPLYFGWIALGNHELGYFQFQQFNAFYRINPGSIVTIVGIMGGMVDILLARSGRTKRTWWGLAGVIISLMLSCCILAYALTRQ